MTRRISRKEENDGDDDDDDDCSVGPVEMKPKRLLYRGRGGFFFVVCYYSELGVIIFGNYVIIATLSRRNVNLYETRVIML